MASVRLLRIPQYDCGLALGTTAQFWMNLQAAYELEEASLAKGAEFVATERIVAWSHQFRPPKSQV